MTKAAELAKMGEVLTNSQIGGRRNIVINGACQVAQRGTSSTGLGGSAPGYTTVDRWQMSVGATSAGRFSTAQVAVTDLPGFANAFHLDCTTADTSIAAGEVLKIDYKIEGQDLQRLKKGTSSAEKVTVSFYMKTNKAFTFMCELDDRDNNRRNGQQFTTTTDWTRHVLTFAGDTTGTLDNDIKITGLQMEVGEQATPFEHRSFAEELALCHRYFHRANTVSVAATLGAGVWYAANQVLGDYRFPRMRSTPSASVPATNSLKMYKSAAAIQANDSTPIDNASADGFARFNITPTSNGTAGQGTVIQLVATSDYLDMDAEL